MENNFHLLIVLTGKTASGKDTVICKLLTKYPGIRRIITTTSRLPRSGERNGVDYNFISKEDFTQKIATGDFIEYVEYGGNFYGTEKSQFMQVLDHDVIWRIDPSRAGKVKEFIKDSFEKSIAEKLLKNVLIIYLTVSNDVILKRLKERGLSQQDIATRMKEDAKFWQQFKDNYTYVVENVPGKLDETVDKLCRIIETRL